MILSDREIQATLTREAAIIEPPPSPKAWSSTAVDLTLDKELRQWVSLSNSNVEAVVCPGNKEYNYSTLVNKHTRIINLAERSHDLPPHGFVLGWTVERIKLPHRARI